MFLLTARMKECGELQTHVSSGVGASSTSIEGRCPRPEWCRQRREAPQNTSYHNMYLGPGYGASEDQWEQYGDHYGKLKYHQLPKGAWKLAPFAHVAHKMMKRQTL